VYTHTHTHRRPLTGHTEPLHPVTVFQHCVFYRLPAVTVPVVTLVRFNGCQLYRPHAHSRLRGDAVNGGLKSRSYSPLPLATRRGTGRETARAPPSSRLQTHQQQQQQRRHVLPHPTPAAVPRGHDARCHVWIRMRSRLFPHGFSGCAAQGSMGNVVVEG